MRTKLVLVVLLVSFAALALGVSAAKPVPAAAPVVKTAVMLPGSAYPWVQPVWRTVNGVVVVTLPRVIGSANTQPPAWVFSR
ncbi:MAG TPA: hypothetical protein VMU72_04410 [Gaiellaceae bacterium]|nr:hypothetical protein [Gaiellaceae bacterium]